MDMLSLALGLGASAGFIATNYILHRGWMLTAQLTAMILVSTQYGLLGVWSVVAINAVLMIRNILFLAGKFNARSLAIYSTAFALLLTVVTVASAGAPGSVTDWLALSAGYLNILAFSTKRTLITKISLGSSSFSWALFNLLQGNWQNVIGDTFGTIAAAVAIVRLLRSPAPAAPKQP